MLGQGKRMEIKTKIAILQKKADDYNAKFDELEATGMPLKEISQYIKESEKKTHEINLEVLPFDEANKTIEVGFLLSSGLDKTHAIQSEAKEMNLFAEKTFQKVLDKKKKLKSGVIIDSDDGYKDAAQKTKEHDKKMKERIYRDHLVELINGDPHQNTKKSNYGSEFVFNDLYKKDCDNQNFDHHYRKNDLKWFSEEYVRHKGTMRK